MLGLVGLESISGVARLTFDRLELVDGVGLVPIVMGLFGVAEILVNLEQEIDARGVRASASAACCPIAAGLEAQRAAAGARHGARLLCWASCPAAAR